MSQTFPYSLSKKCNNLKDKLQTLGLVFLISSNSLAAAVSINGSFFIFISISIALTLLSRKFHPGKEFILTLFLFLCCIFSATIIQVPVAFKYGIFCLAYGFVLGTGILKINIHLFFKYMVLIGSISAPILLMRAQEMAMNLFTSESNAGGMMGMTYSIIPLLLSAISLIVLDYKIIWKLLSSMLIIVYSSILMLIGSRGAFVVLFVFILLYFFTVFVKSNSLRFFLLVLLGTLLISIASSFEDILLALNNFLDSLGINIYAITKAINKLNAESFSSGRTDIWNLAISGFLENPIGHSVGSFEMEYDVHQHNFILQMMWEFGIIGLFVSFSIISRSFTLLFKNNDNTNKKLLYITIFCSSIVILTYSGSYWMLSCFWLWIKLIYDKKIVYVN